MDKDRLEGLEGVEGAPPPYSPGSYSPPPAETQQPALSEVQRKPSDQTFDAIQDRIAEEKHSYYIQQNRSGFTIHRTNWDDEPLFQAKIGDEMQVTEVVLCLGKQRGSRQVARTIRAAHDRDFELYLGEEEKPSENDWITIRCVHGGLMKSNSYHFRAAGRPMAWKRTHDHSLGASRLTGGNYKLIDESDVGKLASVHARLSGASQGIQGGRIIVGGDVMAVHTQSSISGQGIAWQSSSSLVSRIEWKEEFGEAVEMAAVTVLLAIIAEAKIHR